jgi:hypothetical protein
MRLLLVAVGLTVLVACGDGTAGRVSSQPAASPTDIRTEPDPDQKMEGYGLVLDPATKEPMFCMGTIEESLPPGCSGLRLKGWHWDAVPAEESSGGTRWGEYEVTGYYDGETFTFVDARVPPEFEAEESTFDTPCQEPDGGWEVESPESATEDDRLAAIRYAEAQPEHAATWVDYIHEPTEYTDPKDVILNIAFTADADQHEAEIRELWDGPLCVIERHGYTRAELSDIQNSPWEEDYGLETTWSSLNEVAGQVELGVVLIEEGTRTAIDQRYGPGVVVVVPALEPVE